MSPVSLNSYGNFPLTANSMELMSKLSLGRTEPSINMAASTSHQAAHAVLNTNELLCNIIVRMPRENIALAACVCRSWRNALKADLAIQQMLWRASTGIRQIETKLDCLGMRIQDMLSDKFDIMVDINPYMDKICNEPQPWRPRDDVRIVGRLLFNPPPKLEIGALAQEFITQPPINAVRTVVYPGAHLVDYNILYHSPVQRFLLKSNGGVTMGKLANLIQSKRRQHGGTTVTIVSIPPGFKSLCDPRAISRGTRRWEVRNGKVHSQIQTPARYLPENRSDYEDSDGSDDHWTL